ncbi:MAG TPA: phosphoribosylglycinamide formyltransferase [Polyangiales bacterium]|nr:phosphoribosylglycinamide formyltransferase [Polyangiales bacterium]
MTLKLAVLISGRGTNLAALFGAIEAGSCDAQVQLVVSDREAAPGLELAHARGIRSQTIRMRDYADRAAWDSALTQAVAAIEPDLVVLAGFMRLLGRPFIERFRQRVINVHPALLPLFPGTNGPEQAIQAGVPITGCSVHLVDHGVDTGPVIAQAVVPVLPDDDVPTLHARIQRVEHVLLPRVVAAVASGAIELQPRLRIHTPPDADTALFSLPDSAPSRS